jgi:hypothetical protein
MYNLEFTFLNDKRYTVDQQFNLDHPALIPNIITNYWGFFPFKCPLLCLFILPIVFHEFLKLKKFKYMLQF